MKKRVSIIGGGPASLMLAAQLDEQLFDVTIYERNFAVGRKFLVAGKGGFNLTHSEPIDQFINRYTPASFLEDYIRTFSNTDLIDWLQEIDIPTFIGSSKRVYPVKGITPIEVLNAILKVLKKKHVKVLTRHYWSGWNGNNELVFETKEGTQTIQSDITVFGLGGKSWKKTGSDGSWASRFEGKGINIIPFEASNCAFEIKWPNSLLEQIEGESVKNITITCNDKQTKGEVVITSFGLEGGAIYALSPQIREQLNNNIGHAEILIDLKPSFTIEEIRERLLINTKSSWTKHIEQQLKLTKPQLSLLKHFVSKEDFINPAILAGKIKSLPLTINGIAPIDEAISTVGGVSLHAVDQNLQLKKLPKHFVIGEMLDWDAPTGGYLLQSCFSMGYCLAKHLNESHA